MNEEGRSRRPSSFIESKRHLQRGISGDWLASPSRIHHVDQDECGCRGREKRDWGREGPGNHGEEEARTGGRTDGTPLEQTGDGAQDPVSQQPQGVRQDDDDKSLERPDHGVGHEGEAEGQLLVGHDGLGETIDLPGYSLSIVTETN